MRSSLTSSFLYFDTFLDVWVYFLVLHQINPLGNIQLAGSHQLFHLSYISNVSSFPFKLSHRANQTDRLWSDSELFICIRLVTQSLNFNYSDISLLENLKKLKKTLTNSLFATQGFAELPSLTWQTPGISWLRHRYFLKFETFVGLRTRDATGRHVTL